MLKSILKLDGALKLSKNDQKSIAGGRRFYIGSGCSSICPSTCASLGGVCEPCSSGEIECRIYA